MQKLNLCFITTAEIPSRWAHSIQVMKMAQGFQELGHEVELITLCSFNQWRKNGFTNLWEDYGISTPFKITQIPLMGYLHREQNRDYHWFSYGNILAYIAKRKKPDIIFTRDYLAPFWTTGRGLRTLSEVHGEPNGDYKMGRFIEASKRKNLKTVVTISEILAEKYVTAGVPKEKIIVEQDGVDLKLFSSIDPLDIQKIKKKLLNGRETLALYAGHLYDYKGIPLILEAAKKFPQVAFALVGGWDTDVERIRSAGESLGLKNLFLTGFLKNSEIPMYLLASDLLLLPYDPFHFQAKTTSPLKLFEYMGAGRPIVASSIPNVEQVLTNRKNAILYDPSRKNEFIKGIQFILKNQDEATGLAKQARKDSTQYEWKKRCERILQFSGYR